MITTHPHSFGSTIRPRLAAGRRLLGRLAAWVRRLLRRADWYYPEREA